MLHLLLYTFYCVAAIQLFYYLFIFRTFSFATQKNKKKVATPVSVVICVKNKATKLPFTLQALIKQNYPNLELVLINDRSVDNTLEIMEGFKKKYPKNDIKIVDIKDNENFWGNKKYALTLGIKAAKHEYLLFTDADCRPLSNFWVQEMANQFSNNKTIVLGYGAFDKDKKSLLNKLIRYESLTTAMYYFSFAKMGFPYMGVSRNVAYSKAQFFLKNGFANHINIRFGDDDLFINENATKKNTAICFSQKSFTTSIPKKTYKGWIRQKRRRFFTVKYYKPIHKFLIMLFYISQFLFWVLASILLTFLFSWKLIVGIILFRTLIQYIIIGSSAKKLYEKDLIFYIPFLELFLIVIQMIIFIKNKIAIPKYW